MPLPGHPPRRGLKRVTKAELSERVSQVVDLLLGGAGPRDIKRFAARPEVNWGVSPRQIETYIQKANDVIAAEADRDRGRAFNKAVTRLERLYGRCISTEKFSTALDTQKELNALHGLYPASKHLNINLEDRKGPDLTNLTDEELDHLEHILAKLDGRPPAPQP